MHVAVKNQGSCGSCWAFGAAASLESWIAMQSYTLDGGNMMDVSEQVPNFRFTVCWTSGASLCDSCWVAH